VHFGPRKHLDALRQKYQSRSYERIKLRPQSATIGAEVEGVDLGSLDDATFAEIEQALYDYKVLVFRDQNITSEEHLAFSRRFGELEEHPFLPASGSDAALVRFEKGEKVAGYENNWHTDVSWRERPALGSILRAIEVPEVGGDTLFADMVAAYEGLDDALKERILNLSAVHDFTFTFGLGLSPEEREKRQKEFPPVEHPLVRTHPVTGAKAIYACRVFTSHIVGLDNAESDALLNRLYEEATVPE
jgi:taurine dioxygenase